MAQGRLGLDADEVEVVVDGVQRARGVGDLPDDDRGDLDGVAVGVVDLQVVRLEVPHADADVAAVGEGKDPRQAGAADGADVAAEEPHDPGLAGLDDDERGQDHDGRDPRHDGQGGVRPLDEQVDGAEAEGGDEDAEPAVRGPGLPLHDVDACAEVADRRCLGLAVWVGGLVHDPSPPDALDKSDIT